MRMILAMIAIAAAMLAGAVQLQANRARTAVDESPALCLDERVLLQGGSSGPQCGPVRLYDGM